MLPDDDEFEDAGFVINDAESADGEDSVSLGDDDNGGDLFADNDDYVSDYDDNYSEDENDEF